MASQSSNAEITQRLSAIHAYAGTELYAEVFGLLNAMVTAYDEDLREVSIENLRFKQGASKQIRALRESLLQHDRVLSPKI